MSPDRVTVVVPTFNERENLPDLAAAVLDHGYSLLIVDDGSPDGTGEIADRLSSRHARIDVLHRPRKEGLGKAYAQGFSQAIAAGAEVVVEMDADFSHDPADLPRLVRAVEEGADLAIGSRYVPGGATPDWALTRKLISRGGNLYARIMLGTRVKDMTAGFRAFRAAALEHLPYETAEASGYGFQVEMAWHADSQALVISEIPVVFRDRVRGSSKMGASIVLEAMFLVTKWGLGRFFALLRSSNR